MLHLRLILSSLILAFVLAGCGRGGDEFDLPSVVDYNLHVKPILATNCYLCHGPDISSREAGLRLDLRDSAIVALESGETAIVPGAGSESELIRRISSSDPEERMPPEEMKKILSPREIALLKKWIDQGAEWKEHWSLVVPDSGLAIQKVGAIDRYVNRQLNEQGLKPSGRASKTALIRRLSYVLTGLPPTPEGVDAFLADPSPDAYEKLVERLLASPHYGERWARHWMDLVRYADTKGHEFDFPVVGAWQYRDYLIRAFNADVPVRSVHPRTHRRRSSRCALAAIPETGIDESILGYQLFRARRRQAQPGRLCRSMRPSISTISSMSVGKTFQGLTVACAKCHDHKFDPIPTTDYYSWYGIIKSSRFAIR